MVADLLRPQQALRFDSASDYETARTFTKHEVAKSPKDLVYACNQVLKQASVTLKLPPPLPSRFVSAHAQAPSCR
jgi:hypothetical protein